MLPTPRSPCRKRSCQDGDGTVEERSFSDADDAKGAGHAEKMKRTKILSIGLSSTPNTSIIN